MKERIYFLYWGQYYEWDVKTLVTVLLGYMEINGLLYSIISVLE